LSFFSKNNQAQNPKPKQNLYKELIRSPLIMNVQRNQVKVS